MEPAQQNYFSRFIKSKYHAWLAACTIGLGLWIATPLFAIAGVTAYVVGLLLLPDAKFFKDKIDMEMQALVEQEQLLKVEEFKRNRDNQIRTLSQDGKMKYAEMADVCKDIERATLENASSSDAFGVQTKLRKLDELMWTYLRLIKIQESLRVYLEIERKEDVPGLMQEGDAEIAKLSKELECITDKAKQEYKQRFISSRLERMEVLKKRLEKIETAKQNIEMLTSEEDKMEQQVKLLRAEALANRNAEQFTSHIDASIEHLNQTNQWLSEMDEFADIVGNVPDMPQQRVGFGATDTQSQVTINYRVRGSRNRVAE